jgi:hypothetical protein
MGIVQGAQLAVAGERIVTNYRPFGLRAEGAV